MIHDEGIQTLMGFGLTSAQATVYLTLVKLKKADAKTVAKLSNVARQDIYRVMPALERRGLVQKLIGIPMMYVATPLQDSFSILLERKKQEFDNLINRTDALINHLSTDSEKISPSEEDTQFAIISKLSALINLHEKITRHCQNTLDIMVPLRGVPSKIGEEWNYLKDLLVQKKIQTRLITHRSENKGDSTFEFWEPLLTERFFSVRYLEEPVSFGMHIFDGKQLTLSVDGIRVLPSLWSNNSNLLHLANAYFNRAWSAIEKENTPDSDNPKSATNGFLSFGVKTSKKEG
jgi:sugar-specific transcriptional regulator TrmB